MKYLILFSWALGEVLIVYFHHSMTSICSVLLFILMDRIWAIFGCLASLNKIYLWIFNCINLLVVFLQNLIYWSRVLYVRVVRVDMIESSLLRLSYLCILRECITVMYGSSIHLRIKPWKIVRLHINIRARRLGWSCSKLTFDISKIRMVRVSHIFIYKLYFQ